MLAKQEWDNLNLPQNTCTTEKHLWLVLIESKRNNSIPLLNVLLVKIACFAICLWVWRWGYTHICEESQALILLKVVRIIKLTFSFLSMNVPGIVNYLIALLS